MEMMMAVMVSSDTINGVFVFVVRYVLDSRRWLLQHFDINRGLRIEADVRVA